jgi:hypothetical protein
MTFFCRYLTAAVVVFALSAASGGNEATAPDIQVELSSQKPLRLRVTLRSRAESSVTLDKERLPWGNRYSMILVAVTPNGQCLQQFFPIDDPGFEKIALNPKASSSGEVNLDDFFRDLDGAVKKSDIHLFWAYDAPEELHIARRSGGWLLIPQRK